MGRWMGHHHLCRCLGGDYYRTCVCVWVEGLCKIAMIELNNCLFTVLQTLKHTNCSRCCSPVGVETYKQTYYDGGFIFDYILASDT